MGILDQTGSQTLSGSGVVNTESEQDNDSVLFEDTRSLLGEFVPDSDERITFPTMPAELENYGTEIDPQVFFMTTLFFKEQRQCTQTLAQGPILLFFDK